MIFVQLINVSEYDFTSVMTAMRVTLSFNGTIISCSNTQDSTTKTLLIQGIKLIDNHIITSN